jgi:hypothetical protein
VQRFMAHKHYVPLKAARSECGRKPFDGLEIGTLA